ncbi:MAG: GNAT family N-acetyltransferase [Lachnospiraceae bacterium]|nr:GNAT family N-acetyltransferase [Lachnospiraceae bacterium]
MRRAVIEDTEELVKFGEDCFGKPYIFEDEMRGFISDDNNRLFVEEDEGRIIGATLFLNDDKETIMEDMEVTGEDFDRLTAGRPVLHHKFCIVRDDCRGKGVMTKMLEESFSQLEKEGIYGAVFAQAWIKKGDIPIEGILKNMGYTTYKRQISPWYKFSDRVCSVCGGRCKCDAMVYYREFKPV